MMSMACPEGVEDMLTAKPGGIPQIIDRMKRPTLYGGATVFIQWLLPYGECPEGRIPKVEPLVAREFER